MFYEPNKRNHGLPHDPFKALISPRPIGWISTISASGAVNLAPYSFFNAISARPPVLMFSSEGEKDSVRFARETGVFCHNLVSADLTEAMNITSAPLERGASEFAAAGLTPVPCERIAAPRVKEAKAALECRVLSITPLPRLDGRIGTNIIVIGEVVGIHVDDSLISADGRIDVAAVGILARLGYMDYTAVRETFALDRPPGG